MKLTPWFPPKIKPVRVGVYETKMRPSKGGYFQYWDGNAWMFLSTTKESALYFQAHRSAYQFQTWRGIAK